MKTFNTLFLGLFLISLNVFSQISDSKKKISFFKDFSFSSDIMSFGRTMDYQNKIGSINPENRIAKLNEFDAGLYLRPSIKYRKNKFSIWMKPRLNTDFKIEDADTQTEFYFQELKLKWQINNALYITGGRYVKQLGTSIFVNPSNPFLISTGRLNPKLEVRPSDFVELNLSTKKNWDFSLIANVSKGEDPIYDPAFFKFNREYALITEFYGGAENLGAIFSINENKKYHFGFFGQKNINDAVVVWIDGALDYNMNRFYPILGHHTDLLEYEMINGEQNKELFITGLLGSSYTFSFGPTLYLEYLYNGKGYNKDKFDLYNQIIETSVNYNFDITRNLSDLNLGRAINTGMPYIRRNYIFSQLGQNDVFGKLNYNVRYFYSFDDSSSQLSTLFEWNALDNLEVYSVFLSNFGETQSSFKKLINYQLMVGLIWKL